MKPNRIQTKLLSRHWTLVRGPKEPIRPKTNERHPSVWSPENWLLLRFCHMLRAQWQSDSEWCIRPRSRCRGNDGVQIANVLQGIGPAWRHFPSESDGNQSIMHRLPRTSGRRVSAARLGLACHIWIWNLDARVRYSGVRTVIDGSWGHSFRSIICFNAF